MLAIGVYFINVLGNPLQRCWSGREGVVTQLLRIWNLSNNKRDYVKRILSQCASCAKNKVPYHSQTLANERLKGRTPLIKRGSVDEGIIADWMEAGLGFGYTAKMVN